MWSKEFWKATLERVIGTIAAAFVGSSIVVSSTKEQWLYVLYSSLLAGLFTLFKCIVSATLGNNSPSLTSTEELVYKNE